MSLPRNLADGLRWLFRKERIEGELDEELRGFLDMSAQEIMDRLPGAGVKQTGRPADGVDLSRPPANNREKYHSRYVDEENSALFPFG